MPAEISIVAYGSLARKMRVPAAQPQARILGAIQPLGQVLDGLGLQPDEIQLAMVNHRAADLALEVRAGDRVALFPKEYPIFVDWYAFRSL